MYGKRFFVAPSALAAALLLSACAQPVSSVITRDAQLQNILDLPQDEDCWFDRVDEDYTTYLLARDNGEDLIDRLVEACPDIQLGFVAATSGPGPSYSTYFGEPQLASEEIRGDGEDGPGSSGGPSNDSPEGPQDNGGSSGTFGDNDGDTDGDDDDGGGVGDNGGPSGGGQSGGFSG